MKVHGMLALVVLSLAASPTARARGQQPDAAALIAAARQALGGDAALSAIAAFTAGGTFIRQVGPASPSVSFETSCVLPDKFMRVSRHSSGGPMSFEITQYEGFSGGTAMAATVAPDAPFPVTIPGPAPTTPEDVEARRVRQLAGMQGLYLELALPLFVSVSSGYGLHSTIGPTSTVGSTHADVILFKRGDDTVWWLLLDEQTHLPIELRWKAKPVVTFSRTTVVSSRGGAPPPLTLPSGDPAAGLVDVDWVVSIRDYRVADGLNWPHRFTTTVDGKAWEDARVSRYRLNPKIDPKVFEAPKGR